jgi:hypothetical protein
LQNELDQLFVGAEALNAGCRGWEQWVHFNNGTAGVAFIQYGLIQSQFSCAYVAGPAEGARSAPSRPEGIHRVEWQGLPVSQVAD